MQKMAIPQIKTSKPLKCWEMSSWAYLVIWHLLHKRKSLPSCPAKNESHILQTWLSLYSNLAPSARAVLVQMAMPHLTLEKSSFWHLDCFPGPIAGWIWKSGTTVVEILLIFVIKCYGQDHFTSSWLSKLGSFSVSLPVKWKYWLVIHKVISNIIWDNAS